MTDFNKALHDPSSVFEFPMDIVDDESLTPKQKLQVLEQWELDARELIIAEEENMPADQEDAGTMLSRVLNALRILKETAL